MKTAKLFKNGRSQAVRLPRDFRFDGDEVYVRRLGNAVVLLPKDDPWRSLLDSLAEFSDDLDVDRHQGHQQERESLDA